MTTPAEKRTSYPMSKIDELLAAKATIEDLSNPATPAGASLSATFVTPQRGMLTVVIGDSIDIGSDDATYLANSGSWFSRACVASGQKMRFLRNAGVAGNTTAQCLARFDADVTAHDPAVAVIGGGVTNDQGNGVSTATTRANIVAMVAAARVAGIRPVLRNCPPVDTAGTGAFNTTALRRAAVDAHNAWLALYAASEGIPLIDIHRPLVDPATGGYKSGYTSDSVHPTAAATAIVASDVASHLPAMFIGEPYLPRSIADGANILTNGVFTGDSNADGVANNWTGVGGGLSAKSLIAGTGDVVGNWQQGTCSGSLGYFEQVKSTGYAVGDRIAFMGRVTKDAGVAVAVKVNFQSASASFFPIKDWTEAITNGMFYMEAVVPTGTTGLQVQITANTAAGSFQFAQLAVVNLTTLGIA